MNITRNYLVAVKERLMEKLAAAAVPAEALDRARRMFEDATLAAHALSKDALQRIKTRLLEILPSLSPSLASKMVDDADKEANKSVTEAHCDQNNEDQKKNHEEETSATPILINNPSSKL